LTEQRQRDPFVFVEHLSSKVEDALLAVDFGLLEVLVDGGEKVAEEADGCAESVGVGEPGL
jgi:hypothetical protein